MEKIHEQPLLKPLLLQHHCYCVLQIVPWTKRIVIKDELLDLSLDLYIFYLNGFAVASSKSGLLYIALVVLVEMTLAVLWPYSSSCDKHHSYSLDRSFSLITLGNTSGTFHEQLDSNTASWQSSHALTETYITICVRGGYFWSSALPRLRWVWSIIQISSWGEGD